MQAGQGSTLQHMYVDAQIYNWNHCRAASPLSRYQARARPRSIVVNTYQHLGAMAPHGSSDSGEWRWSNEQCKYYRYKVDGNGNYVQDSDGINFPILLHRIGAKCSNLSG
jgi:hypothetical protein